MTAFFTLAFLAAVVRISVPYTLAALGGALSERAGVVNLALEGLLLSSALTATIGADVGGSGAAGILAGVGGGVLVAALYALLVVWLRGDQIVCGVAINLLADGATRFILKARYDSSSNSPRIDAWGARAGSELGASLLHPLVLTTAALVVLAWIVVDRTRFGLRVRAVGEHPAAAASLGVRVAPVRFGAVLLAGALAGLGGAWLAQDQHQFVAGMSNGRGYIALAAVIFGGWRPLAVAASSLAFGAAEAVQITLQAAGGGIPAWLVQMFPYLVTILALTGLTGGRGRRVPPAALGKPAE